MKTPISLFLYPRYHFLSSLFFFPPIFIYQHLHTAPSVLDTVGDGCVWYGQGEDRSFLLGLQGLAQVVSEDQHLPRLPVASDTLPSPSSLWNLRSPFSHPLAGPACFLLLCLTPLSLWPSQLLTLQPHTTCILHSPHDRNCFLKGRQRRKC